MESSRSCDNVSRAHTPRIIEEDDDAIRAICDTCKEQRVFRKDWRGVPLNRDWIEFFKKDTLQGSDNLLYKYHPEFLRT